MLIKERIITLKERLHFRRVQKVANIIDDQDPKTCRHPLDFTVTLKHAKGSLYLLSYFTIFYCPIKIRIVQLTLDPCMTYVLFRYRDFFFCFNIMKYLLLEWIIIIIIFNRCQLILILIIKTRQA